MIVNTKTRDILKKMREEKWGSVMKKWTILVLSVIGIGIVIGGYHSLVTSHIFSASTQHLSVKKSHPNHVQQKSSMRPMTGDYYLKSSEKKPYVDLKKYQHVNVLVSIAKQRVYIRSNQKVLYTMYSSTGKNDTTPRGQYHIQGERGQHFYNASSDEGANYWVSWKDHGIYLFHSVPVDHTGHYIPAEGQQLGKKAASHGCVRLSVSDAKWFYENIPENTEVTIR